MCINHSNAEKVGHFYDEHSNAFSKVYGDVIQAFRTTQISSLLDYEARSMDLNADMQLLDAGCGVGGPAIYFAKSYNVKIDAVTASEIQAQLAAEKIKSEGLSERIMVKKGDFHFLEKFFAKESYDVVYFLESFGHSVNKELAISSAWNMLKPGGKLYIKDLFVKEAVLKEHQLPIEKNLLRINDLYCYNVCNLYEILRQIRQKGFILSFLKTIDIPLEQFENLTISNEFQELTGINRIDDLNTYLFPVDFFELLCIKPWYDINAGTNSYFLQNLYYLQVNGISPDNL